MEAWRKTVKAYDAATKLRVKANDEDDSWGENDEPVMAYKLPAKVRLHPGDSLVEVKSTEVAT